MRNTMLTSAAIACLLLGSQFVLAQSPEPRRDEQKQERSEKNAPAATHEQRSQKGPADQATQPPKNEPSRAQTETPRSSPKAAEDRALPAGQTAQEKPNRPARKTEQSGVKDTDKSKPISASEKTPPDPQKGSAAKSQQQPSPPQSSSTQTAPSDNANSTTTNTNTTPTAQRPNTAQRNNATTTSAPQNTATTAAQQRNTTTNAAQLAPEKQQRIVETIQRTRAAPPVRNLNVNISVGTPVPRYVRVYRLPQEIVSIEPQYRGYDYFTTEEDIVIVEPRSHRVVSMVPRRIQADREQVAQGSTTRMSAEGPPPCRIMRREPNGQITEADLSRSTVGSSGQRSFPIAVTVQTGNGQSTQSIPLDAPAGQIVVATQGNGDCQITIEAQPPR